MAAGEGSTEPEETTGRKTNVETAVEDAPTTTKPAISSTRSEDESEEDEDDDEEEEPHLKYATLTKSLSVLYRNGDASSAFLVAGDKMIVGTQVGNVHVLTLPTFARLEAYRAHTAGISSISVSPPTTPLSMLRSDVTQKLAAESTGEKDRSPSSSPAGKGIRPNPVPNTLSNQIYIATSSIDGNVCIASLVDKKDVQQRNFGRPVQAVALSPEYKSDRSYLSGGRAGNLILTVGGQSGRSANATTTSTAAAASGWLGSLGLGSNTGTDKVLHSGEGTITTIKWSLSGKYVLWVNEHGIKIMRSHLRLSSAEANLEWKRMGHVDYPKRGNWEDMSSVWRAQAEWINRDSLESDEMFNPEKGTPQPANGDTAVTESATIAKPIVEEVVVGWGDTAWILKVYPLESASNAVSDEPRLGRVEVATIIRVDDCTISGISLYTPNVLLVLAYMEKKGKQKSKEEPNQASQSRRNRHTALEPELRLIDITTNEELDADTLSVSRYETLSAFDYHLGILPPVRVPTNLAQKGYLGALGSGVNAIGSGIGTVGSGLYTGVETVGQGVWDATMYGPRKLGANRLFSGTESVRNVQVGSEKGGSTRERNYLTGWIPGFGSSIFQQNEELASVATTMGMKIFIFSPYDCIIAVKRTLADRLQWLLNNEKYDEAWELVDEHPEAAGAGLESSETSPPDTPSRTSSVAKGASAQPRTQAELKQQATLAEFFADSISITSSVKGKEKKKVPKADREKRRVGELWLRQLVDAKKWTEAGEVAAKVLDTAPRWEYWIWQFVRNNKFDEISPYVPTLELTPPIQSSTFEIILGHYVSEDRKRFKELLDQWPSDLFEISSVSAAIMAQLRSGDVPKGSKDWTYLQECLAKLYLADGHYDEALKCYIHLQDSETAMSLIKDHHLIDAIADDIPSFVLLNISQQQVKSASQNELDTLSSEPIRLLVDEATHGSVEPQDVVDQLTEASLKVFVYFYLRSLWWGEGSKQISAAPKVGRQAYTANLAADNGKALVEQFADDAVDLFAEYDRALLTEFLHASTAYTFERAVKICEQRHDVEDLVYLLSKTGEMKKALFLIINELDDVSKAIAFAKEQDDPGLWNDLLEYSMSRPRFISGLLSEVGMAIDPITLVKRIPSGLEIQGLKDGLKKMIREYDLQDSLSTGVANVLMSEVAVGMDDLRRGRRRGIKFDVSTGAKSTRSREIEQKVPEETSGSFSVDDAGEKKQEIPEAPPGCCVGCRKPFHVDDNDTLVGFACGHVYHLKHLLRDPATEGETASVDRDNAGTPTQNIPGVSLPNISNDGGDDDPLGTIFNRSVGPKVTNARLLRDRVENIGGCRVCRLRREKLDEVG